MPGKIMLKEERFILSHASEISVTARLVRLLLSYGVTEHHGRKLTGANLLTSWRPMRGKRERDTHTVPSGAHSHGTTPSIQAPPPHLPFCMNSSVD
jgi:hypothetical protein